MLPDSRGFIILDKNRQRGATLIYVLTLLTIIGLLVGLTWRTIRSNNALAAFNRGDAQARLLALSGLDHALAKIGPAGSVQNLAFATEDLKYRLDGDKKSFELRVRTWGLYGRVRSTGKTILPLPGRSKVVEAMLGQALDFGKLPAVGLLNHEGNMVLAGNAQVTGPVLMWRGSVRKATDYNVRWTGQGGHVGAIWDSTAPIWKTVTLDFERAESWMNLQEKMLAAHDFEKDGDFDSGMVQDLVMRDSGFLADTILAHTRIVASRYLRIGNGAQLRDCKLLAPEIRIEGDAFLERALVLAQKKLTVHGGKILGGQFLAGDTLLIESDSPIAKYPVFYVRGSMKNRGLPDSSMTGAMILKKLQGEGLFLAPFLESPPYDQEIRMTIFPAVQLKGLLYCGGQVQMEGQLQGSLICRGLKFAYKGTIWLGHLKDAKIASLIGKSTVTAPLLFPSSSPLAFGVQGQ